ncbi:dTDP-4-dehydrorhamnose reductase [Streptomyces sp. SCSIO ZS0520]|uniref:dTDP-4-dehydrorhamnose reductase n=1 Tax=Streptomyces sp. SCSIO ZS0520 TaxID=2892996 RepID=UPI0021D7EF20|nr:dTDP-4-dehydrorhamnose reductase [Streptomyces sp. SCSIO ZS0520]
MNGWMVTGAGGMLGSELCALLRARRQPVLAFSHGDLDLADGYAVRMAMERARPRVVVNCAAYTDVDGAESSEAAALRVNGDAVRRLAQACAATGARLLHLSTDYVFDGQAQAPWPEEARPAPRTAYGRSKLAGEQAVLAELPHSGTVVRTAWLYGAHGRNFVATMKEKAAAGEAVRVVDDQHGQPTWARDVSQRLYELGELQVSRAAGIFHATSAGRTTWYEFAREIYRLAGADPALVRPLSSEDLDRVAPRPANSVLGHGRWAAAGLAPLRPWPEALAEAFSGIGTPLAAR